MTMWVLPSNSTSIPDLMQGINTMLGGNIAFIMLLVTIFFISLLSALTRTEFEKSLLFSSWMTTITAFFGTIIFKTDASLIVLPLVLTLVSAILVRKNA